MDKNFICECGNDNFKVFYRSPIERQPDCYFRCMDCFNEYRYNGYVLNFRKFDKLSSIYQDYEIWNEK